MASIVEEWFDSAFDDALGSKVGEALNWFDAVEGLDGSGQPSGTFSDSGGGVAAHKAQRT